MKKSIIIISTLLLAALVASSAFAWGHGRGRGMGSGYNQDCAEFGGRGNFTELSQEQKKELSTLRQNFIDDTYALRSEKFQKKQEMRMLMETSDPDRAKLSAISKDITDLQGQIREKSIDFRLAAKKISPELGMSAGLRHGHKRGFHQGDRGDCQGHGNNWRNPQDN